MKTLITALSGAAILVGLAALPSTAAGQNQQRKRDGSGGNCPRVDCPRPDCPQQGQQKQAGQQQRKRDGSGAQDQQRQRKRDGTGPAAG